MRHQKIAPSDNRALTQRLAERVRERSRTGLSVGEHVDAVQDDFLNFLKDSDWETASVERKVDLLKPLLNFYMPSPTRLALGLPAASTKTRGKVPSQSIRHDIQVTIDAAWSAATTQYFSEAQTRGDSAFVVRPPAAGNLPIENLRHQTWFLKNIPSQSQVAAEKMEIARQIVMVGMDETAHAFKTLACWLRVDAASNLSEDAQVRQDRVLMLRIIVLQVMKQSASGALGDSDAQNLKVARRLQDAWGRLSAHTKQHPEWFAEDNKRWKETENLLQAYLDGCSATSLRPIAVRALFQNAELTGQADILSQCSIPLDGPPASALQLHPSLQSFERHLEQFLQRPDKIPKPEHQLWYGPPGVGKSEAIKSLAMRHQLRLYGWEDGHGLNSEMQHKTAEGRARLLDSANKEAKRRGRLALVAFDEVHAMFPEVSKGTSQQGESVEDSASMQRVMQGLQGGERLSHVLVIACTNYLHLVAKPLRARFKCVDLDVPSLEFAKSAFDSMMRAEGLAVSRQALDDLADLIDGMPLRPLKRLVQEAKTAAMLQQIRDIPATGPAAEMRSALPDLPQVAVFLAHLRVELLKERVHASDAEISDLAPKRGKGFRARFDFTLPIATAAAYIPHDGAVWRLQWTTQPETSRRQLLGRRVCGDATVTAADLQFMLPGGNIYSATCSAVLDPKDVNSWVWSLNELDQLQPGTSEFSDLFISGHKLGCSLDVSFEAGGFPMPRMGIAVMAGGVMASGSTLFAAATQALITGSVTEALYTTVWTPYFLTHSALATMSGAPGVATVQTVAAYVVGAPIMLAATSPVAAGAVVVVAAGGLGCGAVWGAKAVAPYANAGARRLGQWVRMPLA